MSEKILFVLEGDDKEPRILDAIENAIENLVLGGKSKAVYTYCTHIYRLYKELSADPDLELLKLLKADDPDGVLSDADDDTFSSIYLFFDYDGHVNMPADDSSESGHIDGDSTISRMLNLFDDETDKGKLYLSYPMVEAIQHLKEAPDSRDKLITAKCKGPHCPARDTCPERAGCPPVKRYKDRVNRETPRLQNIERISKSTWKETFRYHVVVASLLASRECEPDYTVPSQADIFSIQRSDYISLPCPHVAVLSSFPMFAMEYLETTERRKLMDS